MKQTPPSSDAVRMYLPLFKEVGRDVVTSEHRNDIEKNLDVLFRIARELGVELHDGDRVLDLGCGIGESVEILLSRGIDAYGVDVGEWWGRDYDAYSYGNPPPPANVRERLRAVPEKNYMLPFPDGYFKFVVSLQTFEHVFNYEDVFREIRRVLRPDGVSVNIFPGPGTPIEPHYGIPVIPLCKYDWWLAFWSVFRRSRPTWRESFDFLSKSMKLTNYPRRRQLERWASAAGVKLEFCQKLYVRHSDSRPTRIVNAARHVKLGWAASAVVERICQRAMVIRKAGASIPCS